MKFKISKQEFQKGISAVIHVAYNKTQKSILECILIEAEDNCITLGAFDTVTAMETKIYADILEDGACAIPSRLLFEVVSKLSEGEVTIEKNEESGITISCQNTCIKLQEMDERQFPRFPEVSGTAFTIKKSVIKRLIDKTVFAVYTQTDKPIFTGLLFEVMENTLNVVAIDGIRMARMTAEKETTEQARIVIPAKAVKEAARLISDDGDDNMTVVTSRSACFFVTDEYRIYTRLLEGEFLNYNTIVPSSFKTRIKINTGMLEASLNMVSVISRDQLTNPVKFSIGFDGLELVAKSEYGAASDSVPAKLDGETISMSLNAKYMLDVLRSIDEDEVLIEMENSLKPCIIRPVSGDEYLYLIVPLNVRD